MAWGNTSQKGREIMWSEHSDSLGRGQAHLVKLLTNLRACMNYKRIYMYSLKGNTSKTSMTPNIEIQVILTPYSHGLNVPTSYLWVQVGVKKKKTL